MVPVTDSLDAQTAFAWLLLAALAVTTWLIVRPFLPWLLATGLVAFSLYPAQRRLDSVVGQLTESGLTVHAETDILPRLWQKLVINAGINPFTALLDCPNGDILEAPLFRQWITPLSEEIASLMAGAGQGLVAPEQLRSKIETVARNTARNTSSMRADMLAGRPTEIDYINGYLAALGKTLDIATPVNQMLTKRVKQLND